jgi:hypothetical protein
MTTTIIKIKTQIGKNCITIGDGQKIYKALHKILTRNGTAILDFDGVEVFASPFFNAAIGQLLRDIEPETLNRHLKVESLSPVGTDTLHRVIENSKKYYGNPDYQKSIISLLQEYSEAS